MASEIDLTMYVRDVPDFPFPGILFRDITPLLKDPPAWKLALDEMTTLVERLAPTAVVGIESRGFIFGAPIAVRLGLPFVPIRRAGKLPASRMSIEYALEYGTAEMEIHSDALTADDRVAIVDDLIATGGTAEGASKLVELLGAQVAGLVFFIELAEMGGRERLRGREMHALIEYE